MKKVQWLGVLLMFGGILLLFSKNIEGLTGFAIFSENITAKSFLVYFLGVGSFLIGSTVLVTNADRAAKIELYDKADNKKTMDENLMMTDPKNEFTVSGEVSLLEFKRNVRIYRNDEEVLNRFKKEYGMQFVRIIMSNDAKKARIAKKFYEALFEKEYSDKD